MKEKIVFVIFFLSLFGCSGEFKSDYQGHFLSHDFIKLLKPGLTKSQVILYFGQPLIKDVFHEDNRWDYVYIERRSSFDESSFPIDFIESANQEKVAKNDLDYNDFLIQEDESVDQSQDDQEEEKIMIKRQKISLFFEGNQLKSAIYNNDKLF